MITSHVVTLLQCSCCCMGVGLVKVYDSFTQTMCHAQESPRGAAECPSNVCVSRAGKCFHVSEDCPTLVGKQGLRMFRRCDRCSKDRLYRTARGKAMAKAIPGFGLSLECERNHRP